MRLYSLNGTTAVADGGVKYAAGADGGFDFPPGVAERLHGFAVNGQKLWETDIERQHRLIAEEAERRADPRTLLAAVEQLVSAARATQPAAVSAPAPARPRTRTSAKS